MKYGEKEVMSESKVVGKATYPIYETWEEAEKALGDAGLAKLNAQVRTDEMNKVRSEFNKPQSKSALRSKALGSITVEEFTSCQGDEAKLNALIERKMAEIEKASPPAQPSNPEGGD